MLWVTTLRIAALCGLVFMTGAALGQDRRTLVIGNDRGGMIGARATEIAALNQSNTRVELRGRICYSSCTLYLGVSNLCISRNTTFGFHGPSRNGTALTQSQFDHWSQVMASHFSAPLQSWFLREARFRTKGMYRLTGDQLVSLGYTACDG